MSELPEELVGAVVLAKILQMRHPEISQDTGHMLKLLYASSLNDPQAELTLQVCEENEKVQALTRKVQDLAKAISLFSRKK